MVLVTEFTNMFWGVTIDAGKRYSQVVKQGFHVSMAALEAQSKKPNENVQVMLQHEASEYLLCTLHSNLLQQPLDLNFATGEQVAFSLNGSGVVHLTGYLIPESEDPDYEEESFSESEEDFEEVSSSESDEEEVPSLLDASGDGENKIAGKRKAKVSSHASKKRKLSENVEDNESDGDDDEDDDSEEEEGFSDDFDDEFDDVDEDDATPEKQGKKTPEKKPKTATPASQKNKVKTPASQQVQTPKAANKNVKQDGKTPNSNKSSIQTEGTPKREPTQPPETPSSSVSDGSAKKKKKKKRKKNKEGDTSKNESTVSTPGTTPKTETTPKKRVVAGGTVVEDLKVGHGPEAKPGKMVSVYYVGTLAKSNKRFDSCTDGKPFRFRLNQGEVIKGWDNGVLGMKVGGKRKITVPANQAYGNVKQGPIPPNSALVFEVELKAVS